LRILQANKFHFVKGGAERYYLDVSQRLAARGHTVVPFAMRHPRNETTEYERYFVEEVDYHSALNLAEKVRAGARSIYSRETVRRVSELVAREAPAVAHLHNIYHQISPSLIGALARLGVPVVQTLHDYKLVCPGYLLMTQGEICERCKGGRYFNAVKYRCLLDSTAASVVGFLEAALHARLGTYGKIALFLCPSQFLLEKVAEFGVPREKLVHFPYFLPLESYLPSYERSDYFIYLGRLSREKGVATLLEALRRRGGSRLTCRILGEGPLEGMLKAQAAAWGLTNVAFSGYLQGEELQTTIRNAAFTVVPSEWYENLPFAVLESFALGTPVVGARIGGIPEMVIQERTGLTYTSGDAAELADALDWMEVHPDRVVEMGREARKLDEERYAPQAHLERLEALYARVIR
jgi:glycosyltransferase involved in cell wall biosynthesis